MNKKMNKYEEFLGMKFDDVDWEYEIDPVTGAKFEMKFFLADEKTGRDAWCYR